MGELMTTYELDVDGRPAHGYVIPLGPCNLVFARTDKGMVGCGAVDVVALDGFAYPAVKVKSIEGTPIRTIDDLLRAQVSVVNETARNMGVTRAMSGREALGLF